jgi:alpha-tubulin suppressor-like RCC1 family protein
VSGDDSHACVLLAGGEVYCWGQNHSGELGSRLPRGQRRSDKPLRVERIPKAVSLAVGSEFTCAALSDGSVDCWGSNAFGMLGGGRFSMKAPYAPQPPGFHPDPSPVVGIKRAIAVSGISDHACALLSGGKVMCWGDNLYGQLGDGLSNHGTWTTGPSDIKIDVSPRPVAVKGIHTATQISAGSGQTCAILRSGKVSCWGLVAFPRGAEAKSTKPVEVKGVHNARQVSVGPGFACALIAGGSVKCWGSNANNQLGANNTVGSLPVTVIRGVTGATQVSAGSSSACAVVRGGSVWCWNLSSFWMGKAAPMRGISDAVQVSPGFNDACALRSGGKVSCWQLDGPFGPSGLGSSARSKAPTEVAGIP